MTAFAELARRAWSSPARWSVATQTFVLQVGIAVVVVAAGLVGTWLQAEHTADEGAIGRATAVAETIAITPAVVGAVSGPSPTSALCSRTPSGCARSRAPTSS